MKGFLRQVYIYSGNEGTSVDQKRLGCPYHAAYLSALCARVKHLFLGFAFLNGLPGTLQFSLTVSRSAESR